jgi:excisionase family DNA binding protein
MIEVSVDYDRLAGAVAARLHEFAEQGTPWLTTKEAAVYLRLSPRTVGRLVAERQIPYHRLDGGQLRFNRPDLDAWMDELKREPRT